MNLCDSVVYLVARHSVDSRDSADFDVFERVWTVFGRLQGVFLGFVRESLGEV